MFDDGRQFQVEIAAAHEAVVEHRALSERLEVALPTLAAARAELEHATEALAGETADVHRLERLGPTTIWAVLSGRRTERLATARASQQAAEARAAEARTTADTWEQELTAVRARLDGLGDVDSWHASALAAKETWAIQVGNHGAPELRRLAKQADTLRGELADAREAAGAVDLAGTALVSALQHLELARRSPRRSVGGGPGRTGARSSSPTGARSTRWTSPWA